MPSRVPLAMCTVIESFEQNLGRSTKLKCHHRPPEIILRSAVGHLVAVGVGGSAQKHCEKRKTRTSNAVSYSLSVEPEAVSVTAKSAEQNVLYVRRLLNRL